MVSCLVCSGTGLDVVLQILCVLLLNSLLICVLPPSLQVAPEEWNRRTQVSSVPEDSLHEKTNLFTSEVISRRKAYTCVPIPSATAFPYTAVHTPMPSFCYQS